MCANECAASTHGAHCYALLTYAGSGGCTRDTAGVDGDTHTHTHTHTHTLPSSGTCGWDACWHPDVDTVLSCYITPDDSVLTLSTEGTLRVKEDVKGAVHQLSAQLATQLFSVTARAVADNKWSILSSSAGRAERVCAPLSTEKTVHCYTNLFKTSGPHKPK